MPRRRRGISFAAVLGVVWLVLPLVLFLLDREALLAAHPAHVIALAVAGLVGLVLLVVAWGQRGRADGAGVRSGSAAVGRRGARRSHGRGRSRRRREVRWGLVAGRGLGVLVSAVLLGTLVWLRPFAATPAAVSSMHASDGVRVADSPARIVITPTPTATAPDRGLVFQPGARIDPRAYVPILSAVSRRGFLVVIVKQPFDLAMLATGAPKDVMERYPEVKRWAVGGHSLGGVAASEYAADQPEDVRALVLWASYPPRSLAARDDLAVASVSGSLDGFTTPADVHASRALLPSSTTYTVVDGAVHSSFGDYGAQPGDGTPTVDHAAAQQQIVDATVALLERM
jgi:hypothetical protein